MSAEQVIVAKFGGTSLADAKQIRNAIDIIRSDLRRQCVVVSAPGKRNAGDEKITDLFLRWHEKFRSQSDLTDSREVIEARFSEMIRGLEVKIDIFAEMWEIKEQFSNGANADYAASRGEYLNGKIIALALGYDFVDPADYIHFDENGQYVEDYEPLRSALEGKRVVIPGFYGSMPNGSIKTFSRGGSDITGAIVARALEAILYENWTDVSGLLMADPRVVDLPRVIKNISSNELRELAYSGANVFHEDAMLPLMDVDIPIQIRNTNSPNDPGTRITVGQYQNQRENVITGIAGRKGFTVITLEKVKMNQETGFLRKVLTVLEENCVSFEHAPGGIDTLSIVIDDKKLEDKLITVIREIRNACSPDKVDTKIGMSMITVVGQGMSYTPGIAARIFKALSAQNINVRIISQGASEISIIIGVENADYENAVRAIYSEFCP